MICYSCEENKPDTKPYILLDDLHGGTMVEVNWCDECNSWHTQKDGLETILRSGGEQYCEIHDMQFWFYCPKCMADVNPEGFI